MIECNKEKREKIEHILNKAKENIYRIYVSRLSVHTR